MNLRRISARVAVAGTTTALAAGALVGVTGTAANAATVTNTYTCSIASLGFSTDVDMTVTGDIPVPQYWAGAAVPATLLGQVTASAAIPAQAAGLLSLYNITGGTAKDFAFTLGNGSVPVPLTGDLVTEDGATTWEASGTNKAFITPNPGTYDALMPSTFTLTTLQGQTEAAALTCVLQDGSDPQALATDFTLNRQLSRVTAKDVKVQKGKPAKLAVSVVGFDGAKGGTVTAKEGSKKLGAGTVKNGKVTLNLGSKLKVGKHTIKLSYSGTPSFKAATGTGKVTVTK